MKTRLLCLLASLLSCFQILHAADKQLYPIIENGLWGFIDQLGKKVISPKFHGVSVFAEGKAAARNDDGYGFIDPSGKFIIDPIFDYAYPFENGRAKVYTGAKPYFIDTTGVIIFEHSYIDITSFGVEGCAIATSQSGRKGIINQQGQLLIDTLFKDIIPTSRDLAIVTGMRHPFPEPLDRENWEFEIGLINLNGDVIVPYGIFENINQFSNGYSLARKIYDEGKGFDGEKGVMNEKGQFTNQAIPRFSAQTSGVENTLQTSDVENTLSDNSMNNTRLSLNEVGNKWQYTDEQGKIVWTEKDESHLPRWLNIDYMIRGHFYAGSAPLYEQRPVNEGWGRSSNVLRKISKKSNFPQSRLSMMVDTKHKAIFKRRYHGIKMYLTNTLTDTIFFNAQDSRLNMIVQAMDQEGLWKDIEYLPHSWCGMSYHRIYLLPGFYWEFIVPAYRGIFKTKLRIVLEYRDALKTKKILYSNEFSGSINPAQFWRKRTYEPTDLMDSYVD